MQIDVERCKGCGLCKEVCPLGVINVEGRKVDVGEGCVECKTCMKVCPEGVFSVKTDDENLCAQHVPLCAGYPKELQEHACAITTKRARSSKG